VSNQLNWVLEALKKRRFVVIQEWRELERDLISSIKYSWYDGDQWTNGCTSSAKR